MRILVISDTHGDLRTLTRIVEENQNADYILHLGDCEEECRALLADKPELASRFLRVKGNNDFGSSTPLFATLRVSPQHKIFFTHGHKYGVYYGTEQLVQTAKENHCDIALFGHTHCSMCAYTDGVYVMNPGSASYPRDGRDPSYGYVDIVDGGVMTNVVFFRRSFRRHLWE